MVLKLFKHFLKSFKLFLVHYIKK